MESLYRFFPLDAYLEGLWNTFRRSEFKAWPAQARSWLEMAAQPTSPWEIEEAKARVCGAVESLFLRCGDYYSQVNKQAIDGDTLRSEPAAVALHALAERFGSSSKPVVACEKAIAAREAIIGSRQKEEYEQNYQMAVSASEGLTRYAPIVLRVDGSVDDKGRLLASPDWSYEQEVLTIDAGQTPLPPGSYYLPREWRKGNRSHVSPSAITQFVPVRAEPDWAVWEMKASAAAALKDMGVTWELLRRAVDLAIRSKPETSGSAPKPRVGALIVRDGVVLSEASRNDDGEGGHAEELALKSAGRERLNAINGATVITTLEPCTRTRSPHKTECMKLLLLRGVKNVVIGIADPNPEIRGEALVLLPENGVRVAMFPLELQEKIIALNREFIDHYSRTRTVKLPA